MSSAGLEPLVGAAWIVRRLSHSPALATALGLAGTAALPARIWQDDAPVGVATPFIAFNMQSDGNDVRGVGPNIIMTDPLYTVRAVFQTADIREVAMASAAIHAALHAQRDTVAVAVTGGTVTGEVVAARERPFYDQYNDERGRPFRALGGVYRLYVDG